MGYPSWLGMGATRGAVLDVESPSRLENIPSASLGCEGAHPSWKTFPVFPWALPDSSSCRGRAQLLREFIPWEFSSSSFEVGLLEPGSWHRELVPSPARPPGSAGVGGETLENWDRARLEPAGSLGMLRFIPTFQPCQGVTRPPPGVVGVCGIGAVPAFPDPGIWGLWDRGSACIS